MPNPRPDPGFDQGKMTFASMLMELNGGDVERELTDKLTEVVSAVKLTQKKGSITVTLNVKPATKGGAEIVFVTDELKSKVPEFDRASTLFFIDDENQLRRQDPRQSTINFTIEKEEK